MRQIKIKVEKVQKRQARKLQRAASLVWSKQKFLCFLKSYLILEIRCTDTWSEFLVRPEQSIARRANELLIFGNYGCRASGFNCTH